MKRIFALVLSLASLPSLASAEVSTWTFDPAHTDTSFEVKHLVISTVRGHLGPTTGKMTLDPDDITRSSVQASVDASKIDTRSSGRDADLRSPSFFDVARYPTMTFRSTKVRKVADDRLDVTGDLTVKDITRPVTFDVKISQPVRGSAGELRRGFSATTRINRKEFGLRYDKVVEAGPVVGDEVTIIVEVEAVRDAPRQETTSPASARAPRG